MEDDVVNEEQPDPHGDAWVEAVHGHDDVENAQADNFEPETCAEGCAPKTLFNPLLPSAREVADHNLTHCPYRRWCKVCQEAFGKEAPHTRAGEGEELEMLEYGMDYDHFGDKEDDDHSVTTLVS